MTWNGVGLRRALACLLSVLSAIAGAKEAEPFLPSDVVHVSRDHLDSVPEFRFATRLAERRGVRLWIAGGTAAGWLAACRRRLGGATEQWNFGELYRSTQDADLLVDGTVEDAEAIERFLCRQFPYRRGNQCIWEVRPLRYPRGKKPAALGDPESSRQHTDTQSLGAIELTATPADEPHVRDLRDWDAPESRFLVDATLGRIQFLRSPNHRDTERFRQRENPEIFAVIRYCSKRFQLGLTPSPGDEEALRALVDAFDPYADITTTYARNWLEHNGLKILRNANDLVETVAFLDRIGLRKKLFLAAGGFAAAAKRDGLAYALTREPLARFDVGLGDGPTAAELGLSRVAHDTLDFGTFEAITGSSLEVPNVFESEPVAGESLELGRGFYVRIGDEGSRQTGYRIRMELRPDAREGSDFVRLPNGELLVRNANALRLVRPTFESDPDRWIALLEELPTDARDRGWRERFERTLRGWLADRRRWTPETVAKLEGLMKRQLALPRPSATLLGYGIRALPQDRVTAIGRQWVRHPMAARLLAEIGGDSRVPGQLRAALADDPATLRRLSELHWILDARARRLRTSSVRSIVRIVNRVRPHLRSLDDLMLVLGERSPRGPLLDAVAHVAVPLCQSEDDVRTLLGLAERGESPELWRRFLRQTTSMRAFLRRLSWARRSRGRLVPVFSSVLVRVADHVEDLGPSRKEMLALRDLCPDDLTWQAIVDRTIEGEADVVEASALARPLGGGAAPVARLVRLFRHVEGWRLRHWLRQIQEGAIVDAEFATTLAEVVAKLPPPEPKRCRNYLLDGIREGLKASGTPFRAERHSYPR
jgi:hypothetical protein